MKIRNLDEEKIYMAAKQQFPNTEIRIDTTDVFMKDMEDGRYTADFIDGEFYISTQYAYEDMLVNNNKTRYKIHIYTIEILDAPYHINYTWDDCYYAVYEMDDQIRFMKYSDFLIYIKERVHKTDK